MEKKPLVPVKSDSYFINISVIIYVVRYVFDTNGCRSTVFTLCCCSQPTDFAIGRKKYVLVLIPISYWQNSVTFWTTIWFKLFSLSRLCEMDVSNKSHFESILNDTGVFIFPTSTRVSDQLNSMTYPLSSQADSVQWNFQLIKEYERTDAYKLNNQWHVIRNKCLVFFYKHFS